jgi:hypothetical protein
LHGLNIVIGQNHVAMYNASKRCPWHGYVLR